MAKKKRKKIKQKSRFKAQHVITGLLVIVLIVSIKLIFFPGITLEYSEHAHIQFKCQQNGSLMELEWKSGFWAGEHGNCQLGCLENGEFQLMQLRQALTDGFDQFCQNIRRKAKRYEVPGSVYLDPIAREVSSGPKIKGFNMRCPGSSVFLTCSDTPKLLSEINSARQKCCR